MRARWKMLLPCHSFLAILQSYSGERQANHRKKMQMIYLPVCNAMESCYLAEGDLGVKG